MALKRSVPRQVNDAEPAFANLPHDAEAFDLSALRQRMRCARAAPEIAVTQELRGLEVEEGAVLLG
ncbi:MAG: hypothetical protein ABJA77_04790 [Variovorax sp.]